MIPLRDCFCLDSGTIGTDGISSGLFLSRFWHYRDRCYLFGTVFVSILVLSGQMVSLRDCFCLDSGTIGTDDTSSGLFLSRFRYYRDRWYLFGTVSVSILALSRQMIPLRDCFCLDSGTIETDPHSSKLFLSQFRYYRDR